MGQRELAMANGASPDGGSSVPAAELERTRDWLRRHGLAEVAPTPLLAVRLAARRWTRLTAQVLLAAFIIAVALVYAHDRGSAGTAGFVPYRRWSLLVLTAVVVALVLAQSVLSWWVRRVDRWAAARLPRRVTHPVRLGWRTVLGRRRAAIAVVTFVGAVVLAIRALTEPDATTRYAAVVLLIGLGGVAIDRLVQLHHILARPVVAEDEASLTADVIMRVEDVRDVATPTVLWALPIASVSGTALGWWNDAWLVFVVLGVIALASVHIGNSGRGAVARFTTGER